VEPSVLFHHTGVAGFKICQNNQQFNQQFNQRFNQRLSIQALDTPMTQTIPTLLLTRGLIAAAIVSISACSVYRADKFQGNLLTTEQVASLQVGMNKTQVIQNLGSPMLQDAFNGGRWDYVYRSLKGTGQLEQRVFTVFFDEAGKLARWTGQESPEINQLTALLKGTPKTPQELLALKQGLLSAKASPAPANPAKPSGETTQGLAKTPSAAASTVASNAPAAVAPLGPLNAAIAQPAQNVVQLGAAPVLVSAPVPTPVQVAFAVPSPAPAFAAVPVFAPAFAPAPASAFVAAAAPAPTPALDLTPAPVAVIAAPESAPVVVQAAAAPTPTPTSTPTPVQPPASTPAALPVLAVVYAPTSAPAPAPVAETPLAVALASTTPTVFLGSAAAAQPAPVALAAPVFVGNAAASKSADLREEILSRVNSWRNAWVAKDLSLYSEHYVEGYKGTYDNQMAWLQQRKQVFFAAGNINLALRDVKIVPISPNEVRVAFTQSYKSERTQEVGDKNLYLQRVGNEWKIANEKFLKAGEGHLQSSTSKQDKSSISSISSISST
jgi:outer membrane protein assembly factor BamE (lipoprotein component of BamABCDE complex)